MKKAALILGAALVTDSFLRSTAGAILSSAILNSLLPS